MYSNRPSISIIHETTDLRVFDKPPNIALLADRSGADQLWPTIQQMGEKPYLVHRLDKGTSGVLLVARNAASQRQLTQAFAARTVHKYYVAQVVGQFPTRHTYRIDLPLCRGRKSRYRVAGERQQITCMDRTFSVAQDREGKAAVTLVRCLRQNRQHSWLLVKPITGRTHQIRVHLSWCGFPLLGDHLYGQPRSPAQQAHRLMLHCRRIVVPEFGSFSARDTGFPPADESAGDPQHRPQR